MVTVRFPVSRFWKWVIGLVGFFVLLNIVLAYLIPIDALRQYAERRINQRLTDYTVTVGRAYFNPIDLSLALDDLVLIQNANPDPPVARVERLHARVHCTTKSEGVLYGQKQECLRFIWVHLIIVRRQGFRRSEARRPDERREHKREAR